MIRMGLAEGNRHIELFGAADLLFVACGYIRANGLCVTFDGFGGHLQTGQYFSCSRP
jgi:hypothetical protein